MSDAGKVQTCIYLHRKTRAWLAHQASMEGRSGSDIIEALLRDYHAKCANQDINTPAID
jgi:hypothetical protein